MKKCLMLALVLLIFSAGSSTMAQSGPRKVDGAKNTMKAIAGPVVSTDPSRSILIGGTAGYSYADDGNVTADLVTGFSQPIGSRLYLTGMGKISKDSKYGVELRSNYFLRPPTSGINFFLVSGVGVDWREVSLMTGTVGFGAMKPGEYTSPWATFYVEQIAGTKEIGITLGVLVMP